MFAALALGALSFGGSLLQGFGAKQASAKQARMQAIADAMAREQNEATLNRVNAIRENIGNTLLDARNVVKTAEMAGFNPVTWLNGGGLGYMTDAAKFLVPEYQLVGASQVPQQHSALSAFGGALTAGANAFGTQYRADMSYDLQQQKLNNAQDALFFGLSQGNSLRGALSYGGTGGGLATASRGAGAGGGLSSSGTGLSAAPYPQKWETGKVEGTNPHRTWSIDPTQADAEAYETRYGDIAQEIFGAYNFVADSVRTTTGRTIGDWGKAFGNWWVNGSEKTAAKVTPYSPFAGSYPAWATP